MSPQEERIRYLFSERRIRDLREYETARVQAIALGEIAAQLCRANDLMEVSVGLRPLADLQKENPS